MDLEARPTFQVEGAVEEAPAAPEGMVAVGGKSTLPPKAAAALAKAEAEWDFEVLDTYVRAPESPETPEEPVAAKASQAPASGPGRRRGRPLSDLTGFDAANSALNEEEERLAALLEVAPGDEDTDDLQYFMSALGGEVGAYGDMFSDGEEGVAEALRFPSMLHLQRAISEGTVRPEELSAGTQQAVLASLGRSRIPEHRAVVQGIKHLQLAGAATGAGGQEER